MKIYLPHAHKSLPATNFDSTFIDRSLGTSEAQEASAYKSCAEGQRTKATTRSIQARKRSEPIGDPEASYYSTCRVYSAVTTVLP